jgi:hypothetical protein
MLHTRRNVAVVLFAVVLCFGLAAGSVVVHRPVTMVLGNACEPAPDNPNGYCYGPRPAGGWPFAFLYDDPGTSVRDSLGVEDDLMPAWFLADAATFGLLAALVAVAVHMWRRRRPGESPA